MAFSFLFKPGQRFRWSLSGASTLLIMLIAVCFLMGGGSRSDVLSLLFLRPFSCLVLAYVIYRHARADLVSSHRWLMLLAGLVTALAILHVVPLHPALWSGLPQRDLVVETYRALGASLPWLPLTLTPAMGWNALFSLAVPISALILALSIRAEEQYALAILFILLAVASGIVGLLQVAGPPSGPLYLYQVTNRGAAVGFFSNRNHNALFMSLVFPMLTLFWHSSRISPRQLRVQHVVLVAVGVLLIPMILLTSSRGGLLSAGLGIISAACIVLITRGEESEKPKEARRGVRRPSWPMRIVLGALGLGALGLVSLAGLRSGAFERLMQTDPAQETRLLALKPIWQAVTDFLPLGSGAGSFETVYQYYEPDHLLKPQYFNHAHNDWLEIVVTYGLPGVVILLLALVLFVGAVGRLYRIGVARGAGAQQRQVRLFGWVAAANILILAVFSLYDYPLRVPTLMCVVAVMAGWLAKSVRRPDRSDPNMRVPGEHRSGSGLHVTDFDPVKA